MGKASRVEAEIGETLSAALGEAVASGDYASHGEIVREALRDWQARREHRAAEAARLRSLWDEGLASGPGQGLSADAIKARGRAMLAREA